MASDVFALGLIYAEFLTGAPPPFDVATYHEPAVAVRSGETLRIPRTGVLPELADLVDSMLAADPVHRPTIGNVHATLMAVRATPDAAGAPAGGPASGASTTKSAARQGTARNAAVPKRCGPAARRSARRQAPRQDQ